MNLIDNNGKNHGYWEVYYTNEMLFYKGHYIGGERNGYWETYYPEGTISHTRYYARM